MITVKDFAAQQGCGESIIYRHIRNHKEQLGDNIQKINRKTWITDEGQQYLKQLLTKNNTLVISAEQNTRLQELEQENKQLQEEKEQCTSRLKRCF